MSLNSQLHPVLHNLVTVLQILTVELTDEVDSILYLTDPDTFASLILVNRRWRAASEIPHLYAYHLSRCPSFSLSNNVIAGPFHEPNLPRLRGRFALEVKRNLFEAYLRPSRTTIKLISTSASSSAAFPGGEAFHFSFSSNGHYVLALSSSRICVISLATDRVSVKREFKISRRPVSATILDDASILAVLSTDHQVNIYDLTNAKARHIRSVPLDHPPRTITLSPGASVLAAAYDGGIEVYSLARSALSTDRRAVKCDAVDSLAFSHDGTMLLGTTQNASTPNTVIISAPYYAEDGQGASAEDILSQMWTTQILFPSSSRDCSHATLLPHHTEGQASWTFTHDRVFETFRAVRVDDLRNGTTYFTGPNLIDRNGRLLPCTLPAASAKGELIAAGFSGNELWLYGVPEALDSNLDRLQYNSAGTEGTGDASDVNMPVTGVVPGVPRSPSWDHAELPRRARVPQWQVLLDRYRNLFVKGRQVATMECVSSVRWVAQRGVRENDRWKGERLVAVAPGGVSTGPDSTSDEPMPADGGRILVLDFERGTRHGETKVFTMELGELEPETLEEERRDLDTEVAILRRRTIVMERGGLTGSRVTSVNKASAESTGNVQRQKRRSEPGVALDRQEAQHPQASNLISAAEGAQQAISTPAEDDLTIEEAQEALDGPYSHNSPRSRMTLYRAATAAATSRRQYSTAIPITGRIEVRRADGRRAIPHESDADNWVPPPPPYTRDAETPLPRHLQMTLLPRHTEGLDRYGESSSQPSRSSTTPQGMTDDTVQQTGPVSEIGDSTLGSTRLSTGRGNSDPNTEIVEDNQLRQQPVQLRRPASSIISPTGEAPVTTFPATHSQATTARRRPRSAYADLSAGSPGSQRARLTSPISPIPEPLSFEQWRSISTPASPIHAGPSWEPPVARIFSPAAIDMPQLTLSGSNLQQRLNYPVPPTPTGQIPEPSIPSSPIHTLEFLSPASSHSSPHDPHAPVLPSAQQLTNLQNRYSRAQPRSVPRPVSAVYRRDFGQPAQVPPRAALGATSRSTSPSGNHTVAPARAISRSNSGERTRSVSAQRLSPQRPDYRRLDTIQSVASYISHHSHSRSRSRDITISGFPKRVPSRAERSAAINVQAAKRSGRIGRKKGKKIKLQAGEETKSGEWTNVEGNVGKSPELKKRGVKCIVM